MTNRTSARLMRDVLIDQPDPSLAKGGKEKRDHRLSNPPLLFPENDFLEIVRLVFGKKRQKKRTSTESRMCQWIEAENLLKRVDRKMAGVIARAGPCALSPGEGKFITLADSIIGQQLSNRVAKVLRVRFRDLFPGETPTAHRTLALSEESLRGAGFSRAKVRYVKALAEAVALGELDFNELHELKNEDLIASLTRIPGIGRWTAEMYLIFALNRPDVLPLGDAAIASAFRKLYSLAESDWGNEAKRIAEGWRPWRTVGCWYLWWYHRDKTKR